MKLAIVILMLSTGIYAKCFKSEMLNQVLSRQLSISCEHFEAEIDVTQVDIKGHSGKLYLDEFIRFSNLFSLYIDVEDLTLIGHYNFRELTLLYLSQRTKLLGGGKITLSQDRAVRLSGTYKELKKINFVGSEFELRLYVSSETVDLTFLSRINELQVVDVSSDIRDLSIKFNTADLLHFNSHKISSLKSLKIRGKSIRSKLYLSGIRFEQLAVDVQKISSLKFDNLLFSKNLEIRSDEIGNIIFSGLSGARADFQIKKLKHLYIARLRACNTEHAEDCIGLFIPKTNIDRINVLSSGAIGDKLFKLLVDRDPSRLSLFSSKEVRLINKYMNSSVKHLTLKSEGGMIISKSFCGEFQGLEHLNVGSQIEGHIDISSCINDLSLSVGMLNTKQTSQIVLPKKNVNLKSLSLENVDCIGNCRVSVNGPDVYLNNSKDIEVSFGKRCRLKTIDFSHIGGHFNLDNINNCDLSGLSRLKLINTSLKEIRLPYEPNSLQYVSILDNKSLRSFDLGRSDNLTDLKIKGNPIEVLSLKLLKDFKNLEIFFFDSTAKAFRIIPAKRLRPEKLKFAFIRAVESQKLAPLRLGLIPSHFTLYLSNVGDKRKFRSLNKGLKIVLW